MAKKSRSTMQQAAAARHPDPGDPDPGHPDPAYRSADHPVQQQAMSAKTRKMPGGGKSSPAEKQKQQAAQAASPDQMSASPFGDPSPGDESPRDLPLPRAADDTAALMSNWRKHRRAGRKGTPQRMAQPSQRKGQQSSGDASAFGDPSPGDENPRPIQPRGSQRS